MFEKTEKHLSRELSKYSRALGEIYPSFRMIPNSYDLKSIYVDANNFGSFYENESSEIRIDVRLYARKNSHDPNTKYADSFSMGFYRYPLKGKAQKEIEMLPYKYHDFIINDSGAKVGIVFLDTSDCILGEKPENIGRKGIYKEEAIDKSKKNWIDFYTKNARIIADTFSEFDFKGAYLGRFDKDRFKISQAFQTPAESEKEDKKNAKEARDFILQISIYLFIAAIVLPLLLKSCKG